ncbi:MAG: hypothetical protein Q9186_000067 [Xanthomendoza sp. 1 TL-2023]
MPGRGGRNRNRNPDHYWNHIAQTKPEAQSLAQRLHLDFPTSSNGLQGVLMYPIRRLVITGEDTPENLTLLLGPLWESHLGQGRHKARIEVLICPPPGSPLSVSYKEHDRGSPAWTPRPANAEEVAKLAKVRDMQSKVLTQMGDRKDFTNDDTKVILSHFGNHWVEVLPILEVAVNSIDQGVYLDG